MTMPPNPPPVRECVLYVCMLCFPSFFWLAWRSRALDMRGSNFCSLFFLCAVCLLYRTCAVGLCVCNQTTVDASPLLGAAGCIGGGHAVDAGPPPPACPSGRPGVSRRGALQTGGTRHSSVAVAPSGDLQTERLGGALFGGAFVPVALQSLCARAVLYLHVAAGYQLEGSPLL